MAKKTTGGRSRARRVLRGVAIAVGVLVAVLVLLVGFLHTGPGQEMLRARVEARLRDRVTTNVTLGALRFSLASGITLEELVIAGNDGATAIRVERAYVSPRLLALAGGKIDLEEATVTKVDVTVRAKADGTTNLTGIAKPSAEPPPSEAPKKRELVAVRKLAVRDVNLSLTREDGSTLTVTGVTLTGDVEARPVTGAVRSELTLGLPRLTSVRKEPALELAVQDLATKVSIDLGDGGRGKVTLGPTSSTLRLVREGVSAVERRVSIPSVALDLDPETLRASAEGLELAALSIASLRVDVLRPRDPDPAALRSAALTRATVRAVDVNALAGKPVLASDVVIDAHVDGPRDATKVEVDVTSAGGAVKLAATVDLRDQEALGYDAKLSTDGLDLTRVLAAREDGPPPIRVASVRVHVKGRGTTKERAALEAEVDAKDVHVRTAAIEDLALRASLAKGIVTITRLDVKAAGQEAHATGSYAIEGKVVDAELALTADTRELSRALAVMGRKPPPALAAIAVGRPVRAHVRGSLDDKDARGLAVDVKDIDVRAAGGSVRGTASVQLARDEQGKLAPRDVVADLDVRSVSLAEIGRLRGKELPVAGRADGHVSLRGDPKAPDADVALDVALDDPESTPRVRAATLRVRAKAKAGRIDGTVALVLPSGEELAKADLHGAQPGRVGPIAFTLDVPERSVRSLAPLLREPARSKLPEGARVALRARVNGTAARTHVEIDVDAKPTDGVPPTTVRARADAMGPVATLGVAPLVWGLDVEIPETRLAALPIPADKRGELDGAVRGSIHARGTRADVTAEIALALRDLRKGPMGLASADVGVTIDEGKTRVELATRVRDVRVVEGGVTAALGGRGLLTKAREGKLRDADPALEGTLVVPEAPMATWATLLPDLDGVPGTFGGRLVLGGRAREPDLALHLGYAGYETLAGAKGTVVLDVHGTPEKADLALVVNEAVRLRAETSVRDVLAARSAGGDVKVRASLEADKVALASLLPATARTRDLRPEGTLDAALSADATIMIAPDGRKLRDLGLKGPLALHHAALRIPGTSRRLHDVALRLAGDGDRLAIETLEAHESDRDVADRKLVARGAYAVRTRDVELHASLDKVLVSGGTFGELDAPRAAATAEIDVRAALGATVRRVEVDVRSLDIVSPDRQPRAVQQEVLSLGDVLDVGPGVEVGKLPVPARPARTEDAKPAEAEKTLDLVVRMPNAIHVMQRPLDLWARGEVHVERFGERRVLSGQLVCLDGGLLVGGNEHRLAYGEIRVTDAGPMLDLHFRREPHPAALRDVATRPDAKEPNTWVYAHMVGVLGKQKVAFSGAADGLFEALSIENGGRVRVLARPDLPPGSTTQLPQIPQLRQTAYMSANLPHLAFLDRMNTFADPYASRFSYGRFQDLEAERYAKDGTRRLRVTARPPTIGQSDAEVEGAVLFINTPRVVSGVGVVGGTRLGGGPAVFWEWSSAD